MAIRDAKYGTHESLMPSRDLSRKDRSCRQGRSVAARERATFRETSRRRSSGGRSGRAHRTRRRAAPNRGISRRTHTSSSSHALAAIERRRARRRRRARLEDDATTRRVPRAFSNAIASLDTRATWASRATAVGRRDDRESRRSSRRRSRSRSPSARGRSDGYVERDSRRANTQRGHPGRVVYIE